MMTSHHLHLVSDATGETINSVARACLVQFGGIEPIEHVWSLVRTSGMMTKVLQGIEANPGPVLYTMVNHELRDQLTSRCAALTLRSEEHTSELQSLMRTSYAVFCLKKKKTQLE